MNSKFSCYRFRAALLAAFLLLCLHPGPVMAQVFQAVTTKSPGLSNANAVWFRSGNRLHVLATGEAKGSPSKRTLIIRQMSRNEFVSQAAGLPQVVHGAVDAADFDGDGLQDIVISGFGSNGQPVAGIWLQQRDGSFRKSSAEVPALAEGSAHFGDFDRDGKTDLLLTGRDAQGMARTIVLRNDNGSLRDIKTNLPGVRNGIALWHDVNKDGQPDILLSGQTNEGLITRIYLNNRNTFRESGQSFPGLKYSAAAWSDFNRDGYPDFFITGETRSGTPFSSYYLGSVSGRFTEGNRSGIRQLMHGSVDAADYNGDGWPDVVITGESLERPYTIVLENQSGKGFRDIRAGLPGVVNGVARFGDFDNNGTPDIFLAGIDVCFDLHATVYRNTLKGRAEEEFPEPAPLPMEIAAGPKYYFVFSSCFCDPDTTGKKAYHGFISNIHQERRDFDLNYEFNHRLITRYPGWGWADRGHRTSNAFVSMQDAEQGRQTVIARYRQDGYIIHYINW
ncbi:MAG TPA: VCBS repeat-containing protein [Bacteroidales bacterium]|nr:VCBS repeat-containing protein [Bacteroidales bacterium]